MHPSISENNGIALMENKDKKIYSVGISTAAHAEIRMAINCPERRIIATTIDANGALFAQKQIEDAGFLKQISVVIEDASKLLPYTNDFFDFIYARLVLHYLSQSALTRTLNELYRVLKPKGKIFVVVRSTLCPEALNKDSKFDPDTKMTSYTSNGHVYNRYFHTVESIQEHLLFSGFSICSLSSYNERLCLDFQRTQLAKQTDNLIEVLAIK